ncbi:hypothetical protein BGZ73_005084 [Actinomortierella ambigua]|nr:hypothetical protein BGZ73_005084 [Actinomortierella ambigua]
MRLAYFCIGSIATQDLLISECFLPEKAHAGQVQDIWSGFLSVFQEQDWPLAASEVASSTTDASSTQPLSSTTPGRRGSSSVAVGAVLSDTTPLALAPTHVAVPLINQQDGSCYVYKVVADVVFVAVCPSPLSTLAPGHPVGPTSLPYSYHAIVECLDHLTRALEKYLDIKPAPQQHPSATGANSKPQQLSAALIIANTSLVYEILDECFEQGYPTMPSLQVLDLLIFGTAKPEQ